MDTRASNDRFAIRARRRTSGIVVDMAAYVGNERVVTRERGREGEVRDRVR